jgi:peptidoglycan L-alanyl-D-glutamate endopeptidase CwlK
MGTAALIAELHPDVRGKAEALLAAAEAAGISLCVTQGYRSPAQQAALYAQGRNGDTRPQVTKAPPGYSWHEFRRAFDVAVLHDGKATWPNDVALWSRIGALGKAVGLEWGGDFKTIVDRPHFQDTGGMTLAQARAAKGQAQ